MSIATDLEMFVSGKGEELCDEIASRNGIAIPDNGWSQDLIDTMEEELKNQIWNDSEAMFDNWTMNHGACCCEMEFMDNYDEEEDEDDD